MKKVLFIEDDAKLLTLYQDTLKSKDIHVISVATGKEGLTKIEEEKPDAVVIDVMLPGGINGFDVLEQMKANPLTHDIPVIVLTNLDSEEQVAKNIGAWAYRVKANTTLEEISNLIVECLQTSQK
jgi:DNA-binding response OmpR family regulator